jgi:AcrR family transcriptional regulator
MAEISKGLVYNYFESKETLMEEVIKVLFTEIGSIFMMLNEIKDPFEKLHKMIDLTFNILEERDYFWRLYSNVLLQPETKSIVEKVSSNFMVDFFKSLEQIFRKAKVKNPSLEAKLFGALLDGISFHVLFIGKKYPLSKTKQFLKMKYSPNNLL